jgi:hypothetical protein
MIMSRPGIHANSPLLRAAVTCARFALTTLILLLAIGTAASAQDCGNRYKVCNGVCDRPVDVRDKVSACKAGCDFRLIACDRQAVNASVGDEKEPASRELQLKVIDAPAGSRDPR